MKVYPLLIFCILLQVLSCKSMDVSMVATGSLTNDSIYIKDVRIHHQGYADSKDALASNIVFHLQKHNFKAASYFTAYNQEASYRYTAIADVFITNTGDVLQPVQNLLIYLTIQDAAGHVATIQIASQSYDIRRSDDQIALAQAIAQKIDDMVQKK